MAERIRRGATNLHVTFIVCCAMICTTVLLGDHLGVTRAQDGGTAVPGTVVATIDLERVISQVDAFAAARESVGVAESEYADRLNELREELTDLEGDLEVMPDGARKDAAIDELREKLDEYDAYVKYAEVMLQIKKSAELRAVYERIRTAARELCDERGWDMIVVNDALVELPERASEAEMMAQISARRVIHAADRIDVTADLIARVNAP